MEDKRNTPEFEEYNATLDPEPETTMTDDELQETILEDSNMTNFQKAVARMDEKKWVLLQRVLGAILGIAAGVALFWNDGSNGEQGGFSYSLIIAVVIALLIPNILERKAIRRIPKLRIAMVITLGIMIVTYFLVIGLQTGFKMTV